MTLLYIRVILARGYRKSAGRKKAMLILVVVFVAALLAGCGGASGGSSSSPQASKQFQNPEGPKGKEPVATFGAESGEAERGEASAVLTQNLTARQKADFAKQCATLGRRGLESVFGPTDPNGPTKCAVALKGFAEPLSKSKAVRKDTLSGEIAALRIKGREAYALYHGTDGKDYAMPMEQEGGKWKVGSITTIELPSAEAKTEPPSKKGA